MQTVRSMKIVRSYDDCGAYDSVWTDAKGTKPRPEPMHSVQYLRFLFRRVSEGRLQLADLRFLGA